jgi:hypothetical protein
MLAFSGLPTLLFTAFIFLFVFSLYMIFGGAAKRYRKLESNVSPEFLRDSRYSLLAWNAKQAFSDMSSELKRRTESSAVGGRWAHSRGTIRSLSDRGDKWLAFVLNLRGGQGRIDLQTTAGSFSLEHAGRLGTFRVDGSVLGHINTDSEILDADRLPIGRVRYLRAFTPMGLSHTTPVDLGDRTIAKVHYLSDFGDRIWKAPPLVQEAVADMSKEEALWIIAVIAMKLYSHCRTTRFV